jgi:hypothetical protein
MNLLFLNSFVCLATGVVKFRKRSSKPNKRERWDECVVTRATRDVRSVRGRFGVERAVGLANEGVHRADEHITPGRKLVSKKTSSKRPLKTSLGRVKLVLVPRRTSFGAKRKV